jgi:hypothetical protein
MVEEEKRGQPEGSTAREIIDDLKDWSGRVFQKVREEAVTLSAQGKLKFDLATLKSRRGTEFRKLGMKVFHLIEQGTYDIPEAAENLERLKELSVQIEEAARRFEQTGRTDGEEIEEPDVDSDPEETGV